MGTKRQYKASMRAAFRKVERALDEARLGCYYIPKEAYDDLTAVDAAIERITKRLSVKEWGR